MDGSTDGRDGGSGEDRLRALAQSGEQFIAVGEDGEGHVVIAVAVPGEQAAAIAGTTGVSVGRVEDDEIERLVLAFFAEHGDPNAQDPAFVLALAPAVPEQRAHLATLARAERASLVVLEVPSGEQRAVRAIGPEALDELRDLSREAGIEGA
ncbi:hypothetical protein [Miltoncostaea oceani]|jgi:hypothetical protein|uniref:hypothetical protein n=1 Tax=Miltoncostaea oceani TaxID=2843216 RepID=UPI001C3E6813|nr:hypothetical protein [Miltoncostaea oceani]